ncbi:ABC transporter substrate-binding protein [Aquimarina megaterium]|uniref:ABC transporter substrate-binding protein n=1 Tax=Aquimarina megaterium TaxID=1443666 RepID=UPI000471C2BD|nr:ABC transporter substrate-binding protein [Aquimarina megaterium]
MTPIKIGFLTPYSSIYPNFFPHLATGFYLGLGQKPGRRSDIELIPEFAGSGGISSVIEAAKKLLNFTNVDIVSGMISYRSLPNLVQLIDNRKDALGFFFDMGEMLPSFDYHSPNVFFNSHQLYQSQYALGYWAQKEYQQPGLIITPIYNSGYHLHTSFQAGISAAGGNTVLQSVIPYNTNNPHHLDIESIFDKIRKEAPAYVHALFVGPQGNEFLNLWKSKSWTKDIPLLVAENMLYPDMLTDVKHLELNLYGAMLWNPNAEHKINKQFVKKFKQNTGQPPNLYALQGYETGLLFKELLRPLKKRQWDVVKEKLQKMNIESPRGLKNFCSKEGFITPDIDIVKIKTNNSGIYNTIIDIGKKMNENNPITNHIVGELDSGWVNPYLCI